MISKTGLLVETFPSNQQNTKSTEFLQVKSAKVPIYTGMVFTFRAKCRMGGLVGFLEEFQKTPKMHRIRSLSIERPDSTSSKKARDAQCRDNHRGHHHP